MAGPFSYRRAAWLTFGSVVLLFGALASFPPLPLQDLQAVVLLQLENGQVKLVTKHRACNTKRDVVMHRLGKPSSPLVPTTMPCQCAQLKKLVSAWLERDFSLRKASQAAASLLGRSAGSCHLQPLTSAVHQVSLGQFSRAPLQGGALASGAGSEQAVQYRTAAPPDRGGPSPVILPSAST